jgi:hypothetical protein
MGGKTYEDPPPSLIRGEPGMNRSHAIAFAAILLLAFTTGFITGWYGHTQGPEAAPPPVTAGYARDDALPPPDYYTGIDFDTFHPTANLTLIPLESFQQQVTEYTCGPASAMTVMSHYGIPLEKGETDELRIALEMNTSPDTGTNPAQVAAWFTRHGWNATWGTNGTREMLLSNLHQGVPVMVEWVLWGGHWVTVTGYDTRGTDTVWDDVIIFADSSDCSDDRVDGVTYYNYGQFDAMWFDAHYFPEEMRNRAWVVAVPGTGQPRSSP